MQHLDLLFGARRLWKLRLESCRLVDLENRILGVERQGDLPGEMIPYVYFDFLRSQKAFQLVPIFHHNAIDILSLACLTAIVPFAFRSPEDVALRPRRRPDRPGALAAAGRAAGGSAAPLPPRAGDGAARRSALPHDVGCRAASSAGWAATTPRWPCSPNSPPSRNPYRVRAFEEIAKHYEHREKNYAMALEMTRNALAFEDTPGDPAPRRAPEEAPGAAASPPAGAVRRATVRRPVTQIIFLAGPFGVHRHRTILRGEPDGVVGAVHLHGAAVAPGVAARRRAARNRSVPGGLQAHSRAEVLRQRNRQRPVDGARFQLRSVPGLRRQLQRDRPVLRVQVHFAAIARKRDRSVGGVRFHVAAAIGDRDRSVGGAQFHAAVHAAHFDRPVLGFQIQRRVARRVHDEDAIHSAESVAGPLYEIRPAECATEMPRAICSAAPRVSAAAILQVSTE